MTAERIWEPDWEAFHQHVERIRAEHESRAPHVAAAISAAAFKRWKVAPPPAFVRLHPEAGNLAWPEE